jgi:hypothetical protein
MNDKTATMPAATPTTAADHPDPAKVRVTVEDLHDLPAGCLKFILIGPDGRVFVWPIPGR